MSVFKCKMCGGTIEFRLGDTVGTCDSCGTKQTLPRLDDEKRANLYDRANHFRRNNDFDKAMGIYEQILNEDNTDAEAYWSLVLCRYGVEYVEDPATHKRVPTVNRAQFTSIFDDDNYKSAVRYADAFQRGLYESEAKVINEIQKGILAISQKEEPFDVFICYKETDANGRRTPDSVLANDLYHQLTQEGFKVFFARITLEDKLGTAYEPYIFAALNSARVMVVLGTKPEYFNAVWVKNEWSRYLSLVRQSGGKKALIPAYKDMDPYDLPDEFSHLQAQDMSKLGFMQDLIRGIRKIAQAEEPKTTVVRETVVTGGGTNTAPLLKRAFMFLEDGDWASADEYCEKVLDAEPECAEAYLGKLMAELHVSKREALKDQKEPFDENKNYQKVIRFGTPELKDTLNEYVDSIQKNRIKDRIYFCAKNKMGVDSYEYDYDVEDYLAQYEEAIKLFESIPGWKDADKQIDSCKKEIYSKAKQKMECNTVSGYEEAIKLFESIPGWKDTNEQVEICQIRKKDRIYNEAKKKMDCKTFYGYEEAIKLFGFISGWKDADSLAEQCSEGLEREKEHYLEERKKDDDEKKRIQERKNQYYKKYGEALKWNKPMIESRISLIKQENTYDFPADLWLVIVLFGAAGVIGFFGGILTIIYCLCNGDSFDGMIVAVLIGGAILIPYAKELQRRMERKKTIKKLQGQLNEISQIPTFAAFLAEMDKTENTGEHEIEADTQKVQKG